MFLGSLINLSVRTILVKSGISEISWKSGLSDTMSEMATDAQGNIVVCGLTLASDSTNAKVSYIAKFSPFGERMWHNFLDITSEIVGTSIAIDELQHIYVVGSLRSWEELENEDIFLAKYDFDGVERWRKVIGTPYLDRSLSLKVSNNPTSIYLAGYSTGNISQGSQSNRNCDNGTTTCEDGIVVKFNEDGNIVWVHHISTPQDERVYDLDLDTSGDLIVVGQTNGNVSYPTENQFDHQGDIFVRKLDAETGQSLWTSQVGSLRMEGCYVEMEIRRGGCGIAISKNTAFITGSTTGFVSTLPDTLARNRYEIFCGKGRLCINTLVAKLDTFQGHVDWIIQTYSRSFNNGEKISVMKSGDPIILGTSNPGFLQDPLREEFFLDAFVLRLDSVKGGMKWMRQIGNEGNDHGSGLIVLDNAIQPSAHTVLIGGFGSHEKALNPGTFSFIRKMNVTTGEDVPICIDYVSFRKNSTKVTKPDEKSLFIMIDIVRHNPNCGTTSVAYRTEVQGGSEEDFVQTAGILQFTQGQEEAQVVVEILPMTEQMLDVNASIHTFSLVLEVSHSTTKLLQPKISIVQVEYPPATEISLLSFSLSSDGKFWSELTQISCGFVFIVLILVLIATRFCVGGLRKGKAFQYKTVQIKSSISKERKFGADLHSIQGLSLSDSIENLQEVHNLGGQSSHLRRNSRRKASERKSMYTLT
jgi:hypothetical protein